MSFYFYNSGIVNKSTVQFIKILFWNSRDLLFMLFEKIPKFTAFGRDGDHFQLTTSWSLLV